MCLQLVEPNKYGKQNKTKWVKKIQLHKEFLNGIYWEMQQIL